MIPVRIVENNPLLNTALRHMVDQEQDFELADNDEQDEKRSKEESEESVTLLGLDDDNPLLALKTLRNSRSDENKVIVLTNSHDRRLARIALDSGADGIASKSTRPKDLAALIRSTSAGYRSIPDPTKEEDPFFLLNDTEENIVRLTCLGLQRKEVADALSLSEGTVKRYVSHILALTEYDSISHLAMDMVAQGAIHPRLTWVREKDANNRGVDGEY